MFWTQDTLEIYRMSSKAVGPMMWHFSRLVFCQESGLTADGKCYIPSKATFKLLTRKNKSNIEINSSYMQYSADMHYSERKDMTVK